MKSDNILHKQRFDDSESFTTVTNNDKALVFILFISLCVLKLIIDDTLSVGRKFDIRIKCFCKIDYNCFFVFYATLFNKIEVWQLESILRFV